MTEEAKEKRGQAPWTEPVPFFFYSRLLGLFLLPLRFPVDNAWIQQQESRRVCLSYQVAFDKHIRINEDAYSVTLVYTHHSVFFPAIRIPEAGITRSSMGGRHSR